MAWTDPTFDSWVALFKSIWAALRPGADSTPFSDAWVYQHVLGHWARGTWEQIGKVLARLFPTTTTGQWLNNWSYFVGRPDGLGGYGVLKAHVSSGTDALPVTFTGIGTIDTSHELTDDYGRRYRINESYTSSGAEVYNADIISIDTGLEVNLETGETLIFTNPPANVESQATLVADLDGGRALESDSEGQSALLRKMQTPSLSGNWAHWQEWIEEALPGTVDAWVWPKRNNGPYGHGTTDYCATQRGEIGSDRVYTAAQQATIEDYIVEVAAVFALKDARPLSITQVKRVVSYTFKLSESALDTNQCDWDASANKKTIITATKVDKLLEVNSAYSAGVLAAGDKVMIAGDEVTVVLEPGNASAPVSGSYAKFTVDSWPSHWDTITLTDRGDGTATGFAVCSGGGLILTVHNAIQAYLNGADGDPPDGRGNLPKMGPAKGDYAAPINAWDDTFRLDMIKSAAAIAAEGWIVSHTQCLIGGAAADAGPTYDTTAAVEMMICLEVAVYEDKT